MDQYDYREIFEDQTRLLEGLSIKECSHVFHGIHTKYLVRGLGKRAIIVLSRIMPARYGGYSFTEIPLAVAAAARRAYSKGWKFIVIEYDDYFENLSTFNASQWRIADKKGLIGEYIHIPR